MTRTRIEVDVTTGEARVVPLTADENAELDARAAAEQAAREAAAQVDPVAKLAAFLSANPDVATLIGGGT